MSGDFPRFPELQMLVEGFAVQPGDCATRHRADDEAIRAHNARWSHQWTPCWKPLCEGQEV